MSHAPRTHARAALLALSLLVMLVLGARPALAAGNFTIKTPQVDEKNGEWHVKVRIDLPRAPPLIHTPMRLTFNKQVVDERAIMSRGAEPVHTRMVLDTQPKQIVSMDVDFADPSGAVFKSTYFEFDLRRSSGYFEAGEYVVTLAGPDGDVGTVQKIVLKGDNPPVYRGAMDFSGDAKGQKQKGPKIQAISNDVDAGPPKQVAQNDAPAAGPASTEVAAEGTAPGMVPTGAFKRTPEEETVKEHPKGCGCGVVGLEQSGIAGTAIALLGLGLVATRRRRHS